MTAEEQPPRTLIGRLLIDGAFVAGRIELADGRIAAVTADPALAAPDLPLIAPGLVDLHVHGFGGCDPLEDLAGMDAALARAGTTAFQPTLFPRRSPEALGADAERVWGAAQALGTGSVLGLHLEGPFVNPSAVGGLPADQLAEPSPGALRTILGPDTGDGRGVRTLTVAPEIPGGIELVEELARAGLRASLGHSLADSAAAAAGVRRGARGATHLFNAMGAFHHREAGLVGTALTAEELAVEIIGDLAHVGPEAFALAVAARGPGGLCLISDALSGAGSGAECFCSHGRTCVVADGAAWFETPDGGRALTGSVTSQLEAVQRLVARGVVGAADALRMASETPARALGLESERGTLRPGARADLLILRGPGEDAAGLELVGVLRGGQPLGAFQAS